MGKQLKSFHKNIQVYLIWGLGLLSVLLILGFGLILGHWCQQLVKLQADQIISTVESSTAPKITTQIKKKLNQLPLLDLISWYQPENENYETWSKTYIKSEQLEHAKAFIEKHKSDINLEKEEPSLLAKLAITKSKEPINCYFLFKKSLMKFGQCRLIQNDLLIQFDLTPILLGYGLVYLVLLLFLIFVLILVSYYYIEQIYRAMSNSLTDIESLLKEIFIGNFNVFFSAREFTFTQRVANIMNQMLYFFNEHAEQKNQEIQRDPLTGLYTRRYFVNVFEKEINKSRRYNHDLAFLLIDIDHFKKFNDNYGHLMGDKVLQQTAQLIVSTLRDSDVVARYGGEEIAIILSETKFENALTVAEKLRLRVEESNYSYQKNTVHVTISIGVAMLSKSKSEIYTEIIKRADLGLYEAKRNGRNRVCHVDN